MFNSLYRTSDCGQDLIFHCLRAGLQIWRIKWVATRALCLPKRRKDVGMERGRERGKEGGHNGGNSDAPVVCVHVYAFACMLHMYVVVQGQG